MALEIYTDANGCRQIRCCAECGMCGKKSNTFQVHYGVDMSATGLTAPDWVGDWDLYHISKAELLGYIAEYTQADWHGADTSWPCSYIRFTGLPYGCIAMAAFLSEGNWSVLMIFPAGFTRLDCVPDCDGIGIAHADEASGTEIGGITPTTFDGLILDRTKWLQVGLKMV